MYENQYIVIQLYETGRIQFKVLTTNFKFKGF